MSYATLSKTIKNEVKILILHSRGSGFCYLKLPIKHVEKWSFDMCSLYHVYLLTCPQKLASERKLFENAPVYLYR